MRQKRKGPLRNIVGIAPERSGIRTGRGASQFVELECGHVVRTTIKNSSGTLRKRASCDVCGLNESQGIDSTHEIN